ncbi:MAG: putative rane protein [Herbinix sp.]|jgi:stage II sporulation protein P|nr:putative rane protein [Herbinix sp.]
MNQARDCADCLQLEVTMKNNSIRSRVKLYPILWSIIILVSVYLLIRFATISFSDDIGQADISFKDAFISKLCSKVMESGSSLISFTANSEEEAYAFPISLVADEFALQEFVKGDSMQVAKAQEYSSLLKQNSPYGQEGNDPDLNDEEDSLQTLSSMPSDNIGYYVIANDILSKEYILTNGAIFDENAAGVVDPAQSGAASGTSASDQLEINYMEGDIDHDKVEDNTDDDKSIETSNPGNMIDYTMEQLKDVNFLIRNFYIVDPETKVTENLFDAEKLLGEDMTLKQKNDAPQILIYHTHSQETYIDSRKNQEADTVVGVGTYLTKILKEQYGYNVIHDTTTYDIIDGELDRNKAYNVAKVGVEKILKDNPTIEVIIDLHRDGANKRVTVINGEETAQIMLFNGLSRDQKGPISHLDNPYQQDNLAFSLQMQLKALELEPGLFYKNYLHAWRYNMHLRPKTLLMELGTDKNTLQSAMNAMKPFAEILDQVLQGK